MSCCSFQLDKFLLRDPYATLKVLAPGAAIQSILHCKFWSHKTTRTLAVVLMAGTVGRFALNVHLSWIETPIIDRLPCLTEDQKLTLNSYRRSLVNKLDLVSGLAVLDVFYMYSQRVQVPPCVTSLMIAPVAISVLQAFCLLPPYHRQVVARGEGKASELWHDGSFVKRHQVFVGLDFVKVSCLAVAGLRFGCQLSK
ncbi:hypothetical protein BC941DRAFT_489164 [Chlamydoabsidia padenii]|nr:hypothetical protein BC941DRAFT_489164 [Chlamydoabsidia padenii]